MIWIANTGGHWEWVSNSTIHTSIYLLQRWFFHRVFDPCFEPTRSLVDLHYPSPDSRPPRPRRICVSFLTPQVNVPGEPSTQISLTFTYDSLIENSVYYSSEPTVQYLKFVINLLRTPPLPILVMITKNLVNYTLCTLLDLCPSDLHFIVYSFELFLVRVFHLLNP